jgi:large subunit ribosomal protein L6
MSRIGKLPVSIPKGVEVKLEDNKVRVKGPKGELSRNFGREINIRIEDGKIIFERKNNDRNVRSLHGLTRTLISNMVNGVTNGFEKSLLIVGVGYKVAKTGSNLQINVGYSHPVIVEAIKGIEFEVGGNNKITVKGIDKYLVGQVAANIRSIRPPEPYKGKGIRYENEVVRKKLGKTGKVG